MTRRRVLIVDDSIELARALKAALEQAGPYEARLINDPHQALNSCIDFRPDIVLMDVIMPGMDGGDAAAHIRQDPAFKDMPVIFLTSILGKDEAARKGGLIGHDPVMAKPVTISELTARIEQVLKR